MPLNEIASQRNTKFHVPKRQKPGVFQLDLKDHRWESVAEGDFYSMRNRGL